MFRKNVAGQFIHFQGVDATTGGIKSGVTWTVRRCIDGTFAAATGTVTEDGSTGWYKFAMSQADTNGNNIGFSFTGTGAVPQTVNIITTAADPTDAVRLGLTALPNAAAEAAGGLYTRGTGAGQINQPANGQVDANAVKLGGTTQTGRDIGASVLLSSGTGTGQVDLTSGIVKANLAQILGTALTETAGQIAAAFKKFFDKASPTGTINSLPDAVAGAASGVAIVGSSMGAVASVTGNVGGSVASVTADVGITQAGADKVWGSTTRTLTAFSTALALSVWDVLTANIGTGSSIGLKLKNWALGSDSKALLSSDAQTGVTIPTVTTLTNAPGDSSGVTTLLSRLSALRAGYLDNLSAGAAALESSLQALITTVGAAGAGIATAVWSAVTRVLTAGTNIVLAKGTGVTGFNDLSAADVNAEVDTALADYDGPTHTELTSELGALNNLSESDIRSAVGLTSANLESQLTAIFEGILPPALGAIADAVWDRIATLRFPVTPILDDFNRADEDPATGWTKVFTSDSDIEIVDNQLTGLISSRAVFTGLSPADDQEVYVSISGGETSGGTFGKRLYLLLRVTGETSDAATGYYVLVLSTTVRLFRTDSFSSVEELATFSLGAALTAGDKIGARVVGDTFEVWVNIQGAGWEQVLTVTDSTYPSGKIGVGVGADSGDLLLDGFGGGNFVPVSGANAVADAVWDEDIVADHTDTNTAGKKLSQALILYEGS